MVWIQANQFKGQHSDSICGTEEAPREIAQEQRVVQVVKKDSESKIEEGAIGSEPRLKKDSSQGQTEARGSDTHARNPGAPAVQVALSESGCSDEFHHSGLVTTSWNPAKVST